MAKILVIDDDASLRAMLRATLAGAGHDIFEAGDGAKGVRRLRECEAELVLTDLLMPDRDGLEAIQQIRREFPAVTIMAMSGGGRLDAAEFLRIAKLLGARRTFLKPFAPGVLLQAIAELQSAIPQPTGQRCA